MPSVDDRGYVHASVAELAQHGRRYEGKSVAVVGYAHIEFEFAGLFASKDDAAAWKGETRKVNFIRIGSCAESPWDRRLEEVSDDYVRVEGVLHHDHPIKGMVSLDKITRYSRVKAEHH
jgi:hypothetical protein